MTLAKNIAENSVKNTLEGKYFDSEPKRNIAKIATLRAGTLWKELF